MMKKFIANMINMNFNLRPKWNGFRVFKCKHHFKKHHQGHFGYFQICFGKKSLFHLIFCYCEPILDFLAKSLFILQIYHAKKIKIRWNRLYLILVNFWVRSEKQLE